MKPYYEDAKAGIVIYHGDAREILPQLSADVCITDPVWPNAIVPLFGSDDPAGMFAGICSALPPSVSRLAVHLGCDSDPRFCGVVPDRFAFFRVCWLEMVRPHYKGRLMYGSDIAYLFGEPPPSRIGARVIPGRYTDTSSGGRRGIKHPCPRNLRHVSWLVKFWSVPSETIVDPCCGSGTTLRAAKDGNRKAIGIEVAEEWCEESARRLDQGVLQFND